MKIHVNHIYFFLALCLCFVACEKQGDRIKDADKIEVYFNTGDTVYKHIDSSKELIKEFSKVLNGKEEKSKCLSKGEIRFYLKDSVLWEAGFSIEGGKNGCEFLSRGDKAWRLTYQTGMYLSETLEYIKTKR